MERTFHRPVHSSRCNAMVHAMTRGKKSLDPADCPDIELLTLLPHLEAMALPDTVIEWKEFDTNVTALVIARIVECAVEQHSDVFRKDEAFQFRRRARILVEGAFGEATYLGGRLDEINRLVGVGVISFEQFRDLTYPLRIMELEIRRKAAGIAAQILGDLYKKIRRRGIKGKPKGVRNSGVDLWDWQDSAVVRTAITMAGPERNGDVEAVAELIPAAVREAMRLGHLTRNIGAGGRVSDEQDQIDRHTKRIRRLWENMVMLHKGGGFVIKRKPK